MKTFICIKQPKNAANITVNREYQGRMFDANMASVEDFENCNYVICINNNDKSMRYNSDLFQLKPEHTYDSIRQSLQFSLSFSDVNEQGFSRSNAITFNINNNNDRIAGTILYLRSLNSFNCGIRLLSNINSLVDNVKPGLEEAFETWLTDEELDRLTGYVIDQFFIMLFAHDDLRRNTGCILASTTVEHTVVPILRDIFDADDNNEFLNPGSGNECVIFRKYINQ